MSAAGEGVDPATSAGIESLVRAVVPGALGAYLHGSAGRQRLQAQSDVDVLVVAPTPLDDQQRADLTTGALRVSGRYPRASDGPRPLELTMVVHADLHPWRFPPRCEYLYGEWLRADIESGAIRQPFTSPDLAVILTMVRQCDRPLFGPPPRTLLPPVPLADLVRAGTESIAGLLEGLEGDTTNVLLTLARIWHTTVTGAIATKDAAAGWAAARAPEPVPRTLDRARAAYLRGEPHRWGPVGADEHATADHLVAAIRTAAPSG